MHGTAHRYASVPAGPVVGVIVPNDASAGDERALALGAVEARIVSVVRAEHLGLVHILLEVVPVLGRAHVGHVGDRPAHKLLSLQLVPEHLDL